ncbi:uncharacterized protein LOC142236141 [Haematobia irritans]|uniref:uncharacterized protein LOC142236141 n=1 Tax=Haematobia irritans TaxID=7368 RepID=UPI003F508A91
MDVSRLISEVKKRPVLWNMERTYNATRYTVPAVWQEVADALGLDVEDCKRKWKNLRDTFHGEVRRFSRRLERDKTLGVYNPNISYKSKWVYYNEMEFIKESKRRSKATHEDSADDVSDPKAEPANTDNVGESSPHVKEDLHHEGLEETSATCDMGVEGYDESANELLFEEFQSVATPQAARRLSATLSLTNSIDGDVSNDEPEENPNNSSADGGTTPKKRCRCPSSSSRNEDRIHFLEDLEKEEQKLIQSTNQDISRTQDHIGDSDYNFLVSFLPHMKKMSDLQNLQFRGRMCDLVLNVLAPNIAAVSSNSNVTVLPTLTQAPYMPSLENLGNPTCH